MKRKTDFEHLWYFAALCCDMLHDAAVCSNMQHQNENPWSMPYLFDAASKTDQIPQISISYTFKNLF